MGILALLKALFQSNRPGGSIAPTSSVQEPAFDVDSYLAPFNVRLVEDFKQAELASRQFEQHYGDFTSFLYRADFDIFLRKEVLLFWEPNTEYKAFLDKNHWPEKHPFNFPGPFYTGESDSCGTGIVQAPVNAANDAHTCEYIFRQPSSYYEFLCVLNAAAVEVFDSYSSNGNDYWTVEACKSWWQNRTWLMRKLTTKEVMAKNEGQAQQYLDYLNGKAETDLRRYCYFLDHGVYPLNEQTVLPEL
jgi:hypothetical protein